MYFEDYDIYFSESFGCVLLGLTAVAMVQSWAQPQKLNDAAAEGSTSDAVDEMVLAQQLQCTSRAFSVETDSSSALEDKIAYQLQNEALGPTPQATVQGSSTGAGTEVSSDVRNSVTVVEVQRDPFLAASTVIDSSLRRSENFVANMGQRSSCSRTLCQCAQMHLRPLVEQLRTEANGDRAKFESLLVFKSSEYLKMIMLDGCDVFTLATLEGKFGQDSALVEVFKNIKHRHHTHGSSMAQKVPP